MKCHLRKRHLDAYEKVSSAQKLSVREQSSSITIQTLQQPSTSVPSSSQNDVIELSINAPGPSVIPLTCPSTSKSVPQAVPAPQQQRMERYGAARKISGEKKKD